MGSTVHRLIKLLPQLWPALCRHPSTKHVDQPFDYSHDLELDQDMSLFDVWLSSRLSDLSRNHSQAHGSSQQNQKQKQDRPYIPPGSQRPLTFANLLLAYKIIQSSSLDILAVLWRLNPLRTLLFVLLTLFRGLLPAFRGYSQAMILDEIQNIISSGEFPSTRLGHLILTEGARMLAESLFNNIANHNENIVNSSVRYAMEYQQMQQRLRLDLPTLADPVIRDLLHESDLFVRSFMGMSGFGIFSPFDLIRLLSTVAELLSQLYVLQSTSRSSSHLFLIVILLFPTAMSLLSSWIPSFNTSPEPLYNAEESSASERQERMRTLAHSDAYRSEVALFGLGPWILQSWASARKMILGLEKSQSTPSDTLPWLLTQTNMSEMLLVIQNLPFLLYSSSPTLGSLALYRNSVQSLVYTVRTLVSTFRMAFQSIFFMGAFAAAMTIEPKLCPRPDQRVKFKRSPKGMRLEVRNLSYTYPGAKVPTLRNVNFTLEAGETLAIVGYNGSGKSTLANILLRIFDFEEGQLLVNGVDIRHYEPDDYHAHVTALFQTFSKFNASLRENVGIGNVDKGFSDKAVHKATNEAGAYNLVHSLPRGLDTQLECMGHDRMPFAPGSPYASDSQDTPHGLSGGEWQRVAISRALMRARQADLLVLDEPTSHLDAHAQNSMFKSINALCRSTSGEKIKSLILITHQLSLARRADKVAMFENGTITEFGTHEELMARPNSNYAKLYQAIE